MKFLHSLQVLSSAFRSFSAWRLVRCAIFAAVIITGCTQTPPRDGESSTAESSTAESSTAAAPASENATTASSSESNGTSGDWKQAAGLSIDWQPSMEAALQKARATNRPIMVDFFATWCGPCHMMDEQTWSDPQVIEQAKNWIAVKVDVDKRHDLQAQYGATNLPTIAFLKPDGKPATGFLGFRNGPDTAEFMKSAFSQASSGNSAA